MIQLWARTQLGVSGVGVTDVVHVWFSCGSACYGMMVYGSGVRHWCMDSANLVQVWFSLFIVLQLGVA